MPELIEALRSYVPWLVARHFIDRPGRLNEPIIEYFDATILFADISGFSKLARHLSSEENLAGPERLTSMLNRYFGALIDIIWENGGDVVKFAGDGLYAVWPAVDSSQDLATLAQSALQAALRTQRQLHNYEIEPGYHLSLRIGLSAGNVGAATVGGVLKRWEFLLAGSPLARVNMASEIAERGEVVVDHEVRQLLPDIVDAHSTSEPNYWLVKSLQATIVPHPIPPLNLAEEAVVGLGGFIAGAITSRLNANQIDWLAENRRVSVMFVNIRGLTQNQADVVDKMQSIMRAMQLTLYRHEGSVRQFIIDDKGTVFIAAFGVPPLTHEDDPIRCIHAAVALKQQLNELGYTSSIGIATGNAFCGPVGNSLRREYAMVGDVVVLSARLMGQASDDQILTDSATATAARTHVRLREAPARRLKGYDEPISVFVPQEQTLLEASKRPIIGRAHIVQKLTQSLDALEKGQGHALIIEGGAGVGKTRFVRELKSYSLARRVRAMVGRADFVDRTTPYHAWRDVLSAMFEVNDFAKTRSRSLTIMAKLAVDPELSQLAPLLNTVLPLDIQETETTQGMSSETRAENTRYLLLKLLELDMSKKPTVIVIEDAHWMDSASWALALAAVRSIDNLLLVVVMRPMDVIPAELIELSTIADTKRIQMVPLSLEETAELIGQTLGAVTVEDRVSRLVHEKSNGNPLFIEQLVFALNDAGYIAADDGECHLKQGISGLDTLEVPDTLTDVITSRVDRLPPQLQLTLKVASVIGENFMKRTLIEIYPLEQYRDAIQGYLDELAKLELITKVSDEPAYAFQQSITRDVAYNLMLFSQRKELHEATARWYERNYIYDLSPFFGLLAYHWQEAGDKRKPIEYLEKAAQKASRNGAYREVIDFLARAEEQSTSIGETRKIRWASMLGEAYWGVGDLHGSRTSAEQVLNAFDHAVPKRNRHLIFGIAIEVLRQIAHRLLPQRFLGRKQDQLDDAIHVVRAYNRLQEIYYFSNNPLPTFYSGFKTLNLAENIGEQYSELAGIYANSTIGMGIIRLRRLARLYERLALKLAETSPNQRIQALVANRIAIYKSGIGQWDSAQVFFEQALVLYRALEDKRGLGETLTATAYATWFYGDFEKVNILYAELEETASTSNNREHKAWALSGKGILQIAFGNPKTALDSTLAAQQLLEDIDDRVSYLHNLGMLAAIYYTLGDYEKALQHANRALYNINERGMPISYYAFGGYTHAPHILMLLKLEGVVMEQALINQGLRQMRQFARIFPVAQPRYSLLCGIEALTDTKITKATRYWYRAEKEAQKLTMPYESALALYYIGTYGSDSNALQQANTIFDRLNATPYPVPKGE